MRRCWDWSPIGSGSTTSTSMSRPAQCAGLRRIIMPRDNEPDLQELPKETREQMEFILVDTIDQVFDAAFDGTSATRPRPSPVRERQAAASLKDVSKPSQA